MKQIVRRYESRAVTLILTSFWLASCAGQVSPTTAVAPAVAAEAATPIPSATLVPTATAVPTARPLVDPAKRPGAYRNNLLGVSLQFPSDWDAALDDESEFGLAQLVNPQETIYVFLETEMIPEDQDFESLNGEFFDELQGQMGLRSVNWATSWIDTVEGERMVWMGLGEGIDDFSGELVTFELVAAATQNRNFQLITISYGDAYGANESVLGNIKKSFEVFSPRPYGVERENALFLPSGEPRTLDPAKWLGSAGGIIGDLFSGLIQLDTSLQPIPELAESWDVSPDGRTYTFHLRQGVTFHDGRPFTAEDVKYSWERAADPETESNTALTYLGDITGVPEVLNGEADEISGLQVVDDHTLEITLDAPKSYFLSKLAYPTSWIVDQQSIDTIEESPNGTGPFMLAKYDEGEVIILARNPNYHRGFVPLEYIVYLIFPGPSVRLYESGDIDRIYIDEDLLDRAKDPEDPLFGSVQDINELCTNYVIFDFGRPPFDDPLVRRAFALAIDKERYNEVIGEGRGVIARGLYPPGLPGHNPDARPISYDPAAAREALQASSYGGSTSLPEITFTTSGAGRDLSPADALLIDMWRETLGVEITVEQIDSESYLEEIYAGNHGQLMYQGWCADYPDPENFADILFHSESKTNHGRYSNSAVDEMLEQARAESDLDTRLALYREIEQMLIDDVAAGFVSHSRAYYLVTKPYIQGLSATPIEVAQHMNVSIERSE